MAQIHEKKIQERRSTLASQSEGQNEGDQVSCTGNMFWKKNSWKIPILSLDFNFPKKPASVENLYIFYGPKGERILEGKDYKIPLTIFAPTKSR